MGYDTNVDYIASFGAMGSLENSIEIQVILQLLVAHKIITVDEVIKMRELVRKNRPMQVKNINALNERMDRVSKESEIEKSLEKFFKGEATEEERKKLQKYISAEHISTRL